MNRDVFAMLLKLQPTTLNPLRKRAMAPSCRGGASSLLRLARPAALSLPSTHALSSWVQRAAVLLGASAAMQPAFGASEFGAGPAA
jgi:hypothetical protein